MELLLDPTAWVGLATLVVLEIVLGIDNLIFIAILAERLPPAQRDRARVIGLLLALVMRLVLLSAISWIFSLTQPLLDIGPLTFAGRDLILIAGGFFLVFKGTLEMHERIEGKARPEASATRMHSSFWVIVTQIVVLDAVFSLDSVVTAVGMVSRIEIMMAAVIIAVGAMLLASKPLTRLVTAHPTAIILCLGFLLMIGFALLAEGFGFHVPKGYLYAAIIFAVLIETLNQVARRNLMKIGGRRPLRERTAEGILRMLGKRPAAEDAPQDGEPAADGVVAFGVEERNMVSGVLKLADRNVRSIMTPRTDISWIDLNDDAHTIEKELRQAPHGFFPVCRGTLDELVGIGRAKDMMSDLLLHGRIRVQGLRPPIIVHDSVPMLELIHTLKRARGQLVIVADEFGAIEGLVTPIDVFEAIAGDFPDEDEAPDILPDGPGRWKVDGATDLHQLEQELNITGLVDDSDDYTTLAGYLLSRFGHLPETGEQYAQAQPHGHIRFEVLSMEGRRIGRVLIERHAEELEAGEAQAA